MKLKSRKKKQNINYMPFIDQAYIGSQAGVQFSSKEEALHFFLMDAWPKGIDPCAIFSTNFYLQENPDVRSLNINPLEHFILYGFKESRDPHFLFDMDYYNKKTGIEPGVNPLEHYLISKERVSPSPYFNEKYYLSTRNINKEISGLEYFIKNERAGSTHPLISDLKILSRPKENEAYSPYNYFTYKGETFFRPEIYDKEVPGARSFGLLRHFYLFGKKENRITASDMQATLAEEINGYDHQVYDTGIEFLADQIRLNLDRNTEDTPELSIVIVSWNKSGMTIQCVAQILASTKRRYEIIIVDNGSYDEEYEKLILLRSLPNLKIIRLEVNRYFGEANNIGVEEAKSETICFLNNDAFVTTGWESPLLSAILNEGYSSSSPKLLFPDGRLQEAGGQINSCGQNVQFGKGLRSSDAQFNFDMDVDHASAACLLMRKETFARVGGFDLRYEPAYYEDADLSAKLKVIGKCIRYKPKSVVYHVENATSKDPRIGFDFLGLINTNRIKFVERWGNFLRGEATVEVPDNSKYILESRSLPKSKLENSNIAVVYTPYDLTPGGGERYILSLAVTLSAEYITYFATPTRYSYYRLQIWEKLLVLILSVYV